MYSYIKNWVTFLRQICSLIGLSVSNTKSLSCEISHCDIKISKSLRSFQNNPTTGDTF
jgi:hypothetical protein